MCCVPSETISLQTGQTCGNCNFQQLGWRLLPEHGNGEVLAINPAHVHAKKTKQPTKHNRKFRQSLSPASKPRSAAPALAAAPHRGMEEDARMERTGVQPPGSPHTSLPRGLPEGLPPPPGSVGGSRGVPGIAGRGRSRVNGRALAAPRPRPRQSAPAAASAAMTI